MTFVFTPSWWMLVPLLWTLFFFFMLIVWVRMGRARKPENRDGFKVVCAFWLICLVLMLLTRLLP